MDAETRKPMLEMWGGVECTYNRVYDTNFDEIVTTGHHERRDDLDLFADLGLTAIRYPAIWEKMAPNQPDEIDWTWTDERLCRLRDLGMRPLADLVHHGSGPRYAEITTPGYPEAVAHFAGQVARRYPWLETYTIINEPLTTARFCGLYGVWYPHARDLSLFVRILLNEIKATVLAMRAIREVNPRARLLATEDVGRVYSTPHMAYQANFENERRWISLDLLHGRVGPGHALWNYLLLAGIAESELRWFQENRCPPDIFGLHYYPTSDRYLDERVERYPARFVGANEKEAYADVEAVRVRPEPLGGFSERLREVWDRYRIPTAITEAHLGCTREEQLRWLTEAWEDAEEARGEGVDVRAVTAWSLLGAYNWNSLVTRDDNYYEPGVFDVRSGKPRPTALASLVRELASGQKSSHSILNQPGWWRRPERILYPPQPLRSFAMEPGAQARPGRSRRDKSGRPLLILGANGTLGRAFRFFCDLRGLPYYALTRQDLDIADSMAMELTLEEAKPWAIVNATGLADIERAERERELCLEINAAAAANLAAACAHADIGLLCFSSAEVFGGEQRKPYRETDAAAALNHYGRSKIEMERRVLAAMPGALVVRTGPLFGIAEGFPVRAVRRMASGGSVEAAADQVVSPTFLPHVVNAALDLLIDGAEGRWHLANTGSVSYADFACMAAGACGIAKGAVEPKLRSEMGWAAERPAYSALASDWGALLPDLEEALALWARDVQIGL